MEEVDDAESSDDTELCCLGEGIYNTGDALSLDGRLCWEYVLGGCCKNGPRLRVLLECARSLLLPDCAQIVIGGRAVFEGICQSARDRRLSIGSAACVHEQLRRVRRHSRRESLLATQDRGNGRERHLYCPEAQT